VARRVVPEQYLAIAGVYPKWQRAIATARRAIPKWQRAIATARRAITDVETGAEDWMPIKRAKDRLYKLVDEAATRSPLSYKEPALELLYAEISALPSIEAATERGREVRERAQRGEIKRLREEEREAQRPYAWMRKVRG
jgi:hypothetical protein